VAAQGQERAPDTPSNPRRLTADPCNKVTALSKALADLGRGTSLQELLRIIRFPGYTTPAEFAFTVAMVDSMAAQVSVLAKQEQDLLAAGRQVVAKTGVAA
jgi:hypothetical protein